jgi:hypothetical protein
VEIVGGATAGSEELMALLHNNNTGATTLRSKASYIFQYLERNSWEVEVIRKLFLKCDTMDSGFRRSMALALEGPVDILEIGIEATSGTEPASDTSFSYGTSIQCRLVVGGIY